MPAREIMNPRPLRKTVQRTPAHLRAAAKDADRHAATIWGDWLHALGTRFRDPTEGPLGRLIQGVVFAVLAAFLPSLLGFGALLVFAFPFVFFRTAGLSVRVFCYRVGAACWHFGC